MNYVNFDLEASGYVDRDNVESFSVRVTHSPAGQQKRGAAEFSQLPIDVRSGVRMLDRRGLDRRGMIHFGALLGDALFPPGVRQLFERSRATLTDAMALRIRLSFDHGALATLPWEYVYVPRPESAGTELDGFLALNRQTSLVRQEMTGQAPTALEAVNGPLRFVALLSSPNGLEPLKIDRERAVIEQSLSTVAAIEQEYYPRATIDQMLDAFGRPAHIFHFAGHGVFEQAPGDRYGSREGKGFLILEDEQRRPVALSAERLALALQSRGVRLAVLGGCQTGQRDGVNQWSGAAPALVRAGVPAVVGMQFRVYDANAIAFNRQFYQTLVAGHEIDTAITAGRLAIMAKGGEDDRDWGVPVLYMRGDAGAIFPLKHELAQAANAPDKTAEPRPRAAANRTTASTKEWPTLTAGLRAPSAPGRPARTTYAADAQSATASSAAAALAAGSGEMHGIKVRVRDLLNSRFNMADLEVLSHTVGVDFEEIPGNTRLMKSLSLVEHMARRERMPDLITAIRAKRPGAI